MTRAVRESVATTAAGYCRVSTADQSREGVSLDAQADRVRQYCDARGLALTRIYIDAGVSGGVPLSQRPEGAKLLEAIKSREGSVVVATIEVLRGLFGPAELV